MKINQENLKNLTKKSLFEYQKLFPILKKEKTQQYGTLALTFFTMTFFGIFAVNPTLTTIAELHKTREDARFVDTQLTQKIANLQSLRAQYDSLVSDIVLVDRAIPQNPEPVRFVGQIQTIAATSGIALAGLRLNEIALSGSVPIEEESDSPSQENENPVAPMETKQYTFNLTVEGTYPQLRDFLTILTHFDRLTSVDALSLSRRPGSEGTVILTVQGTTYFKP